MRVLIADTLPKASLASLEEAGHKVTVRIVRGSNLEEALQELAPQVLVVKSTRVTGTMLSDTPSLELIVRAGAGTDNIDVGKASSSGIFVANCPGRNASAVAELTIGLITALDRRIPDNVHQAREGKWDKLRFAQAEGLRGRTLGIIGLGQIGREVARIARAIGMEVIAWSRSLSDARAQQIGVRRMASPVDIAHEADIITLHVAATRETRHLADRAFFEAIRPGALFVNTSRGSVVDEQALERAIKERGIRAGLDVFEGEPAYSKGPLDTKLSESDKVYLTHHIGASTRQAQEATAAEAVRVINTYGATGNVLNCINLAVQTSATQLLTVRHLDKVGVLASVMQVVREHNLNVQEMENQVFAGEAAAVARIRFTGSAGDSLIAEITQQDHVLAAQLIVL